MRGGSHLLGGKSRPFLWASPVLFVAACMMAQPCISAPGHFENTANLANAREGHTATVLTNGKVLVAGGKGTSGPAPTAELFDSASNAWTLTGSLLEPRYSHTATLLLNGKVL